MSKVENNHLVSINYIVTDKDSAELLDKNDKPFSFVMGRNQVVVGLENALKDKKIGDKFKVEVAPKDAYGEKNNDFFQEVPKEHFSDYESVEIGGNTFYKITQNNRNIIIAYSKIGKIHASLTCATMILHFGVECVIFSGVAGGLRADLAVGDTILATSLCQYDVDITAFGHPLGFIPESKVYFETNANLNNIAKRVAKAQNIDLKEGIIASGDSS